MVRHKKAAQVQGYEPVQGAISLRAVAVDTPKSFATRAGLISARTMPLYCNYMGITSRCKH
jgi:hypothetical protein